MIHTEHLGRRFGKLEAVRDLSLAIPPGELFALLGPNGAGKTTTVRMLAGLISPTSGSASVMGYDVASSGDAIRGRIGLLTESPGLYERLSAWENLLLFARLHEVREPEARVERYLRLLDLWESRAVPTGGFSKGMKQKVAVARALLHEPELIFLDEPTSGLDPASAKVVRSVLEELKAEGRTIFLTTHNLIEAERLADRIGVLDRRLIALDTPERLHNQLFGHCTTIRFAEALPTALDIARAVPGIASAKWRDGHLDVEIDDPRRRNPVLVEALVGAGARIREVTESRVSLEDVYLRLLKEAERDA